MLFKGNLHTNRKGYKVQAHPEGCPVQDAQSRMLLNLDSFDPFTMAWFQPSSLGFNPLPTGNPPGSDQCARGA